MNQSDQKRISDHFRRSIRTYDEGAKVQKEVGAHLVDRLEKYPGIQLNRVLEIGCCTGSMTHRFCTEKSVKNLWVNDLVHDCCTETSERVKELAGCIYQLPGDIESLLLPADLDLVVSSSTFQWLQDLPGCIAKIGKALHSSGYLVFSMFGPGTMEQIKTLTGVGLNYTNESDLADIMSVDFTLLEIETSRYTVFFKSPRDVLRHIQMTGVGGVRSFRWTPRSLKKFENEYRAQFGEKQGIPLDYVSTCVIARKKMNGSGNE